MPVYRRPIAPIVYDILTCSLTQRCRPALKGKYWLPVPLQHASPVPSTGDRPSPMTHKSLSGTSAFILKKPVLGVKCGHVYSGDTGVSICFTANVSDRPTEINSFHGRQFSIIRNRSLLAPTRGTTGLLRKRPQGIGQARKSENAVRHSLRLASTNSLS